MEATGFFFRAMFEKRSSGEGRRRRRSRLGGEQEGRRNRQGGEVMAAVGGD